MNRRAWLISLGAFVAVVVAGHLADVSARQALLEAFLHKRHNGTARIVEAHGLAAGRCASLQRRELFPLAAAFLTVESFATPQLAAWARSSIARIAAMLGVPVDLSFGPGRIRASTARQALSHGARQGSDSDVDELRLTRQLLTRKLLDSCGAIEVVLALLERVEGHPRSDVEFVREAAVVYNGQTRLPASLEAEVAARIYFELVYNLFQHYRFAQLAMRASL